MARNKAEDAFYELCESFNDTFEEVYFASKACDIKEHWDVGFMNRNREFRFDVKAVPNHKSLPFAHGMRWCEVRNGNGDIGWLEGEAEFIAFEEHDYWIIVKRELLLKFVKEKCYKHNGIHNHREAPIPYVWHTRKDKNDLMALIPTIDLCYLGKLIKKKDESTQ